MVVECRKGTEYKAIAIITRYGAEVTHRQRLFLQQKPETISLYVAYGPDMAPEDKNELAQELQRFGYPVSR